MEVVAHCSFVVRDFDGVPSSEVVSRFLSVFATLIVSLLSSRSEGYGTLSFAIFDTDCILLSFLV